MRWVSAGRLSRPHPVGMMRLLARCVTMRLQRIQKAQDPVEGLSDAHPFPPVSPDLVEKAHWYLLFSGPWKYPKESIHLKEGRASVMGLRWVLRSTGTFGKRVLMLIDNLSACGSFNKGRGATLSLLRLNQRILAISIAGRLRCRWRYLESARNPTDGPTRPGSGPPLPNSRSPGAARGSRALGVEALQAEGCTGLCPPGLCRCRRPDEPPWDPWRL